MSRNVQAIITKIKISMRRLKRHETGQFSQKMLIFCVSLHFCLPSFSSFIILLRFHDIISASTTLLIYHSNDIGEWPLVQFYPELYRWFFLIILELRFEPHFLFNCSNITTSANYLKKIITSKIFHFDGSDSIQIIIIICIYCKNCNSRFT